MDSSHAERPAPETYIAREQERTRKVADMMRQLDIDRDLAEHLLELEARIAKLERQPENR